MSWGSVRSCELQLKIYQTWLESIEMLKTDKTMDWKFDSFLPPSLMFHLMFPLQVKASSDHMKRASAWNTSGISLCLYLVGNIWDSASTRLYIRQSSSSFKSFLHGDISFYTFKAEPHLSVSPDINNSLSCDEGFWPCISVSVSLQPARSPYENALSPSQTGTRD